MKGPVSTGRTTLALLVAFSVGLVALPALGGAGDRRDDRRERREERREDRRDDRKDRRDDRKDARDDRRDELRGDFKQKHQDWVEKREDRREERRAELEKKWGDVLDRPLVKAELRTHARRVARVQRVAFLADANGRTDLAVRAKELLEKEAMRHQQRMERLRAEGPK